MIELKVERKSLERVNRKLKKLKDFPNREVGRSLDKFANTTVRDMKHEAPVDTGNLRQHIEGRATKDDVLIESKALAKGNKDYAVYQEYGSRFQDGTPYFWRNIKIGVNRLVKELELKIKKATA